MERGRRGEEVARGGGGEDLWRRGEEGRRGEGAALRGGAVRRGGAARRRRARGGGEGTVERATWRGRHVPDRAAQRERGTGRAAERVACVCVGGCVCGGSAAPWRPVKAAERGEAGGGGERGGGAPWKRGSQRSAWMEAAM